MKKMKWTEVGSANGNGRLPAGGYVIRIDGVEDNERDQYLELLYDVAEGEHAGHFSDDFATERPYIHSFRQYYTDAAERYFSSFLAALEESNDGFSVARWEDACDPQALVGLEVGIVVQVEKYTNTHGEDKERLNVEDILPTRQIRDGDYTVPPVKDSRTKPAAEADDSDVPF